jgi:hypothetical protein
MTDQACALGTIYSYSYTKYKYASCPNVLLDYHRSLADSGTRISTWKT